MNDEPLASIEREVLGWPGVWKKRDENGSGGVADYGFGGPRIGHDDGVADLSGMTGWSRTGSDSRMPWAIMSGSQKTCPEPWNSSA